MTGDRFLTSTVKRLGEEWFFTGAFVVFSPYFCYFFVFCLVVKRKLLNLHAEKALLPTAAPSIKLYKLKILRNVFNIIKK